MQIQFSDQGSNLSLLHCGEKSEPLDDQGSPSTYCYTLSSLCFLSQWPAPQKFLLQGESNLAEKEERKNKAEATLGQEGLES